MQKHDQKPGDSRDDERAEKNRDQLLFIASAKSLCRQAGRTGAQEIEGDEDDVEDNRANRYAAKKRGVSELSDHCGVDDANEGDRDIGERHRHGEAEDHTVGDVEGTNGLLGLHSGRCLPPSLNNRLRMKSGTTTSAPAIR